VVGIPRNAVVVGNPEPMPGKLMPLVGAEEEAKAIAALLNTQPILANQATKATVARHASFTWRLTVCSMTFKIVAFLEPLLSLLLVMTMAF
jgi:hypothetical protein